MINEKFVILGAILNLYGSVSYVLSTLKGRTKPNRVTWSLWALAPAVAFGAQIDKGVGLRALMTFMVGFGPLLVLIASFVNKKAYWKLTRFDFICGGLSLIGLALWMVTKEGDLAIALAIAADGLAAVPTVVKAYKEPKSENPTVFTLGAFSALITLATINNWTFAYWGFPLYIFLICALIAGLIKFRTNKLNLKKDRI